MLTPRLNQFVRIWLPKLELTCTDFILTNIVMLCMNSFGTLFLLLINTITVSMAAIKRFFEKRKLDVKFKRAGEGHKLTNDGTSQSSVSLPVEPQPIPRAPSGPSAEQKMAADAALARMNQQKSGECCCVLCTLVMSHNWPFLGQLAGVHVWHSLPISGQHSCLKK